MSKALLVGIVGSFILSIVSARADEFLDRFPHLDPRVTNAEDEPGRSTYSGNVSYERRSNMIETSEASVSGNYVKISFEPFVAFLPASITINLDDPSISHADFTLLRLWLVNLLSYHRNTTANVGHDFEVASVNLPVYFATMNGQDHETAMIVTVSAGAGWRWMVDGDTGPYVEPRATAMLSSTILSRIFASAYVRGSYTAIGDQTGYGSAALGTQLGVGIAFDNRLRFVVSAGIRFDGANDDLGLPEFSEYLGAGLEWGAPSPMSYRDGGLGGR